MTTYDPLAIEEATTRYSALSAFYEVQVESA